MMMIQTMVLGEIGTNCYILEDQDTRDAAVIDPGGDAAAILARVRADGVKVTAIFLTHGHYDHTAAVAELRVALPGVPVYLHPEDARLLGQQAMPHIGATMPYGEGDVLAVGGLSVKVLHTPGHTPGGVCLWVGDTLFTGDTLFQGSMGRTDLLGGSDEAIFASLKRLAELPGDYQVLPGHMGASTLHAERAGNYYMKEATRG